MTIFNSDDEAPSSIPSIVRKALKRLLPLIILLISVIAISFGYNQFTSGKDAPVATVEQNVITGEPVDDKAIPHAVKDDVELLRDSLSPEENSESPKIVPVVEQDSANPTLGGIKWQDNPQDCGVEQYIALEAPHYCIDKPGDSIPLETAAEEEVVSTPVAEPEPAPAVENNPAERVECDDATQWYDETYTYCIDKPVSRSQSVATSNVQVVHAAEYVPEPVVVPAPVAASGDCSLVYNYSNWNQNVAYAVCMAESGGNPNAWNPNDNHGVCQGSGGLMQLACFWIPNPLDPVANVQKANEIYSQQGWQPWGAYTNGSYLSYL